MAVNQINLSLVAAYPDGRPVSSQAFVQPLAPEPEGIALIVADRGRYQSAFIRFCHVDIAAHRNAPEPYAAFDEEVASRLDQVGRWLLNRAPVLQKLASDGLDLRLLVDMWIDQDQMEMLLPPTFSSACGQAGVPIHLITND